jgi:4-amino-4-deoxy-L-arabinose transferase-like glycosyltransferase
MIIAVDMLAHGLGISPDCLLTLLQLVMTSVGCALIYRIIALTVSESSGLLAGILSALAPANPVYSLFHMPESPSNMFWLLTMFLMARSTYASTSRFPMFVSGICLALAAMFKPVFFYLFAPMAIAVLMFQWPNRRNGLILTSLFLSGFVLGITPAYLRNYAIWKDPIFSPQAGSQLYLFVRPRLLAADGDLTDDANKLSGGYRDSRIPNSKDAWQQKFGSSWDNLARRHDVYNHLAQEDIKSHALRFLKLWAKSQINLYAGTGTVAFMRVVDPQQVAHKEEGLSAIWSYLWRSGWWIYQVVSWLLLAIIYLGALLGVVALLRRKQFAVLTMLLLFLVYFALAVTLWPSTRYRFPMMCLFSMLAGCSLELFKKRSTVSHSAALSITPSDR